jgi:2-aminoadipate transaminase
MAQSARHKKMDGLLRRAAEDPRVIGLAGGLPAAERFPRRALGASFLRALARPGIPALQYGWPEGALPLRQCIAARLRRRGATVSAEDVIVTNGAQQAITIAAEVSLGRGDAIDVDPQTYPSALATFRSAGLLPSADGRARVRYRMPAISNPRGVGMSAADRRAALAGATYVIEDDAYGELRFAGAPPRPLLAEPDARARIIHVGTFSKSLSPGLRVGYLIVPPPLRDRALRRKQDDDLQANSLSQAVVEDYLAHNDFDRFLQRLRHYYGRRAQRLVAAVRRHLPGWRFEVPEGGFGLWLEADESVDEVRLLERSLAEGVSFDPGSSFCCAPSRSHTQLRLCFSAAPEDALEAGARRLARAWRAARASRRPGWRASPRVARDSPRRATARRRRGEKRGLNGDGDRG